MVAQYGIKDINNSAWDGIRSPRERSEGPRKPTRSTRRRRIDESCFNSYADDDDDDELDSPSDRKKPEQKPRIKPEPISNVPMNYSPYMYQHIMPPYPQYVQRPVQSFMTPNTGLNPSYQSTNFQFNQMQQPTSSYAYQMSPQLSPFTMAAPLNNTHLPNINRNQENTDGFYPNNSSNFCNFETLLNDPMAPVNGALLGDEFAQPLQGSKRLSHTEKKLTTPVIKSELRSDSERQPELAGPSSTILAHNDRHVQRTESVPVIEAGVNIVQSDPGNNSEAQVKQEELGSSILISD